MAALFCLVCRSVVVFFLLTFLFFPVISHQPPVNKDERVALFQFLHHANAFPRRTSAAYVVTCEFSKGDELWPYARITGLSFRCDSDSNPSLPPHPNPHFHSSNFTSLKFLGTDFISNCFNDETRAVSLSDSEPSLPGHSNPQFHSFNLISFKSLRRVYFASCFNEEKQAVSLSDRTPGPIFPPALEELVLIDNPGLVGNLSDIFRNCPKLRRVVLTGNGLHGEIPEGWGNNLVNLEELTLSRNQLSGKVPSNLAKLKNLTVLDLRDNKLEGSVPVEFALSAAACDINLENNNLSGKVPFCAKIGGKLKLDGNPELCAEKGSSCSLEKLKACPSEVVIPNAVSFAGGSNPLLGILILMVFICFLILHVV